MGVLQADLPEPQLDGVSGSQRQECKDSPPELSLAFGCLFKMAPRFLGTMFLDSNSLLWPLCDLGCVGGPTGLTSQKAGVFFSLSPNYATAQSCPHGLWDEGLEPHTSTLAPPSPGRQLPAPSPFLPSFYAS